MATFAIIENGGKQYKVAAGEKLKIEKTEGTEGDTITFDKVLLVVDGDTVSIGAPYVSGAKVEAKLGGAGRERKKIVFRYHSKTRYRKKKGHRQHFTEVEISKV